MAGRTGLHTIGTVISELTSMAGNCPTPSATPLRPNARCHLASVKTTARRASRASPIHAAK